VADRDHELGPDLLQAHVAALGDAGLADAALACVEDDSGGPHERLRLPLGLRREADRFMAVLYPGPLTEVRE